MSASGGAELDIDVFTVLYCFLRCFGLCCVFRALKGCHIEYINMDVRGLSGLL